MFILLYFKASDLESNTADEKRHVEPEIFQHENPSNKKIDETESSAKSYHKIFPTAS